MDSAIEIWNTLEQSFAHLDDTIICNLQYTLDFIDFHVGKRVVLIKIHSLIGHPLTSPLTLNLSSLFNGFTHSNPFLILLSLFVASFSSSILMVFRFLNGPNDTFSTVRSQIILMDPKPDLDKVHSLVLRKEA
ncbi:Uncharacterized protein TCM_022478 [Theobroma cacao]|uniref:Uncharacterized protein n=1 Tax=Theobroma cacao TaxID=3641 RepID=A0A061ESX5_THECC|nr:Uncharacterized protein TCM_022478 [Theobroma cacao]